MDSLLDTTIRPEQWCAQWCPCKRDRAEKLYYRAKHERMKCNDRQVKLKQMRTYRHGRRNKMKQDKVTLDSFKVTPVEPMTSEGITVSYRLALLEINFLKFQDCTCPNS